MASGHTFAIACFVALLGATGAVGQEGSAANEQDTAMRIRVTVNGTAIIAALADSATARDFASLLPLTLTFEDYASTEKIGYLPRKLTTQGAEPFADTRIGDINYYAP
jgi:hypothetical protein